MHPKVDYSTLQGANQSLTCNTDRWITEESESLSSGRKHRKLPHSLLWGTQPMEQGQTP